MAKHYVRDRGMSGLGWIGHVGLGQDETYYGTDDDGSNIYLSNSTGAFVNEDGDPIVPVGSITSDSGVELPSAIATPAVSAGTGQTYYGTDSKGNDVWVNSKGQYVNQDGLPITPAAGAMNVEGGGTVQIKAGSTSTASLTAGTSIAAGVLPALLAPGPAPRVAVPVAASSSLLTGSTIIPGVSNLLIIGGGLLAMVMLMGKK